MDSFSELDALLEEDVEAARRRASTAFDDLSAGRDIVLMGAGGLGRRTLTGLRDHRVRPVAFADNDPSRQGTTIDGVPVMSPRDAADRFGASAIFVVTIWGAGSPHRFAHSREQLQRLGCRTVTSFPALFWRYADGLLPFYLQDEPSKVLAQRLDVRRALSLWEDDASRVEYVAQVRFRLHGDFDALPQPVAHRQYFPDDLFVWRDDEWFVDGGAYDGDTIDALWRLHGDCFGHVLAAEPDPTNYTRLLDSVAALPQAVGSKVRTERVALSDRAGTTFLNATGTASSAAAGSEGTGSIVVGTDTIDAMVGHQSPTVVKLDIEGAEPEALRGAKETILRSAPVIAVCVYHRQEHLWTIPLMLAQWRSDYAFFLRPHNQEGWDLVCYAIPRARLIWKHR